MAVAAEKRHWAGWLLLLVLVWTGATVECGKQDVRQKAVACTLAPNWTAGQVDDPGRVGAPVDPVVMYRGNVVLVALTAASSKHSMDQAHELASLESFFHGINMSDVTFLLVNVAGDRDHLQNLVNKNVTLAVFQESLDNPVWSKLQGRKDHVYIYDRCGRLTYSIPFPMSIIHPRQQLVESAVISTYLDDLCGKCNVEVVNVSTDDSVEREMLNSTHNILVDVTQIVNITEPLDFLEYEEEVLENTTQNGTQNHLVNSTMSLTEEEHSEKQIRPTLPTAKAPNTLWSLFHKIWRHMPWTSNEDSKEERLKNSVKKFGDEATTTEPFVNPEEILCNFTRKTTCKSWPKKKLEHVRTCCNLHVCNTSQQHQQKHCKHYTKHRCEKVELILKCCQESGNGTSGSENSEKVNPRAVVSLDAKS